MTIREYKRICKQAGCGKEFIVSAPSIEEDRRIGFSEPEYCEIHRAMHARSYSRIACHHFEIELTPEGEQILRKIEQQKVQEMGEAEELKGRVFNPWNMPAEGVGPGGLGCFKRPLRAFIGNNAYQTREIKFQIAEKREELLAALEDHQVVILVGTTGSGKSTYVPWLLLTDGKPGQLSKWARRGPICVTQPRIQATRQVPRFIANSLNGTSLGVGAQIGFTHSNAEEYDRRTRLLFMTDGKLINDIVSGAVGNYSIVMIDEAHERSVNIDLILGLLRDQLYLYPHLRVIIASATIDFGAFLGYFYPRLQNRVEEFQNINLKEDYDYFKWKREIPFIYSEGRRFPITEHWWGAEDLPEYEEGDKKGQQRELIPGWWKKLNNGQLPTRDQLPGIIAQLVQDLCNTLDKLPATQKAAEDGHILVFLPGSHEIDQTVSAIKSLNLENVAVLPLYAQRPLEEQDAALDPKPDKHPDVYGKRRVVVSTNVAETSLTVEGVRHVIDSGYIKLSYWNPYLQISELQTVRHSQAGCRQRWGRAGRVSAGHAYMLYTKKQFSDIFPPHSTPEIARSSLEQVLLTAKAAGVRTARDGNEMKLDFTWMPLKDQADSDRLQAELKRAFRILVNQKALDEKTGDLSRYGLELRGMPAAMEVSHIFNQGEQYAMGIEVATLVPFLKAERGVQGLLLWKSDWDAYTKLTIRRNHLDLFLGCEDDLDLYLKLWILWDQLTEKQRQEWETSGGIDYKSFHERIELERRKLLERAIDWRKAENRPISIEKIDALRALIAACLSEEIYQPIESIKSQDGLLEGSRPDRLKGPDVLSWDSHYEGADSYEEYDDEFTIDPTYSTQTSTCSGVYRRINPRLGDTEETASIEISPISVCFAHNNAEMVVVCQRRTNLSRPARSKIAGLNVIRINPEWIDALKGSSLQRALLFARLSRLRNPQEFAQMMLRLFIPWLIRRGERVVGVVKDWNSESGARLELTTSLKPKIPLELDNPKNRNSLEGQIKEEEGEIRRPIYESSFDVSSQEAVSDDRQLEESKQIGESNDQIVIIEGWLPIAKIDSRSIEQIEIGKELSVEVEDYNLGNNGSPVVILRQRHPGRDLFTRFVKRFGSKKDENGRGKYPTIEVEMRQILRDPLGRNPMFVVREIETGLEIPMSDRDFCGQTHPQPYFGMRFDIGDRFDVDIIEIDTVSEKVTLSRGRQLVREYCQITDANYKIVELPVARVDSYGVYFYIGGTGKGTPYIGFVRRGLWPAGFNPKPKERIDARLRRLDRNIKPEKLLSRIEEGNSLPEELDLGIELDLRIPPAFERFQDKYNKGDVIDAIVEKQLESGALLIGVEFDLKAQVFESELGIDENGNLQKARDFAPGEPIDVRITQMLADTATIRCSISRVRRIRGVDPGQQLEAKVMHIRPDFKNQQNVHLTCSVCNLYPVQIQAPVDTKPYEPGDKIFISVQKVNNFENQIIASFQSRTL